MGPVVRSPTGGCGGPADAPAEGPCGSPGRPFGSTPRPIAAATAATTATAPMALIAKALRLVMRKLAETRSGDRHRPRRVEEEWWQPRRDVGEGEHVVVELDPQSLGHEPAPAPDPVPHPRVALGELGAQRRVGEGDAVLDVRREVRPAGRRDDVDLEVAARAQLHVRAGGDGGVDPLVEGDLVAGVEEDAEERVAEPPSDDLVQRAAGRADAQCAVPLGDRLEIRADEPTDV